MRTHLFTLAFLVVALSACVSQQTSAPQAPAQTAAPVPVPSKPLGFYMPADHKTPCNKGSLCAAMDQQQKILEERIRDSQITVSRTDDHTLRLDIPCDILFDVDSDQVNPNLYSSLSDIAHVLAQFPDSVIHIYGFTDSTASYAYNQDLSERRAYSVAHFLMNCGIYPRRIVTQGYSESFPRSTNTTAEGRSLNRRVEIMIRAKTPDGNAFKPFYGGKGTTYTGPKN